MGWHVIVVRRHFYDKVNYVNILCNLKEVCYCRGDKIHVCVSVLLNTLGLCAKGKCVKGILCTVLFKFYWWRWNMEGLYFIVNRWCMCGDIHVMHSVYILFLKYCLIVNLSNSNYGLIVCWIIQIGIKISSVVIINSVCK